MISYGIHVKFAHFVLLAVSEEAKTSTTSMFFSFNIIQLNYIVRFGFVISRIIKVSVIRIIKVLTLIMYSGYRKNLVQYCLFKQIVELG